MDTVRELQQLLGAQYRLVVIVTHEEDRATRHIVSACETLRNAKVNPMCISWDIADGFRVEWPYDSSNFQIRQVLDPLGALEEIEKLAVNGYVILRDFHEWWNVPHVKRKLRNLAQGRTKTGRMRGHKTIVITCPTGDIPEELQDEAVVLDFPLPREEELGAVLDIVGQAPSVKIDLNELQRQKFLRAALGLTEAQARRVFTKAATRTGKIDDSDIKLITEEKRQVIRQSEALEFFPVSETLEDVGGLKALKEWLKIRETAFSEETKKFIKDPLKGLVLVGIPGTGKSLAAKTIGSIWRLPVLRLDVGALFGNLMGQSEANVRHSLRLAETIAPCILWIDEMEKAFAHGDIDGGTSKRVFGSILTWMSEKTAPIFVVGTANDIGAMPPELLRKGRFDEVFFLDLPSSEERKAIFELHLKKREKPLKEFDVQALEKASAGYVGAEIEQSIIDACWRAHADRKRPVKTDDILWALRRQVPLAKSHKEAVAVLKGYLEEGRWVSASYKSSKEALSAAPTADDVEDILVVGE